MPLRLDITRKLTARSDRVKSVDIHPTEPWVLASLYNGNVHIWNYRTQVLVKTFEITELPVRAAKFVARKQWLITGSDDLFIRVFNYNTSEKLKTIEAHQDYIRSIAVHPSLPLVLSSSDDMLIKLWNWEKNWTNTQVFDGHSHYVMMVAFNPKDSNTFASCSLDRTVKVWSIGVTQPNFTLEGHEKGVNSVSYYPGGDKPYLITGSDDKTAKVWDYQNKTCVQTLEGHTNNLSHAVFHPDLPIIMTGSEDGCIRVWHANTYRLETTLNYGMERVWCIGVIPGQKTAALGYDEGTVMVKLGRDEPPASMDNSGKIVWARNNEFSSANVRTVSSVDPIPDGERLPITVKEAGTCEVYPQTLRHNANGHFAAVCGDGQYTIYTALKWKHHHYGEALEFVWGAETSQYAARESTQRVRTFKNWKEASTLKPSYPAEQIFGGALLAVKSRSFLMFYEWESLQLVRKIDVVPKNLYWSDSGDLLTVACEENFHILRFNRDCLANLAASSEAEGGLENAFEVLHEVTDRVRTGRWVGDCFLYTTSSGRLNYSVGRGVFTLAHLDRPMYLLGFVPTENKVYLIDREYNIVAYGLLLALLEYQSYILRSEFELAERKLPEIPPEHRNKLATFLESQGLKALALSVCTDQDHLFELATELGDLEKSLALVRKAPSDHKWHILGDLALRKSQIGLAEECLTQAGDLSGLLLLYSSICNATGLARLAETAAAAGKSNVAFLAYFLTGKLEECLSVLVAAKRLPEAAFMARTYLPSEVSRIVGLWKADLTAGGHLKVADILAEPLSYPNLFPELELALKAEALFRNMRESIPAASEYADFRDDLDRDILGEIKSSLEESPEAAAVS